MAECIIFYDINSQFNGLGWNVNTLKTRYSLNYKGLLYKTVWVEYPDIEAKCKEVGIPPTGKKPNGSPFYTLPAIYDPSTETAVADSILIADYLDKTYPETPKLLPAGSYALQHAFNPAMWATVRDILPFALKTHRQVLNQQSLGYFRSTRQVMFGVGDLDELLPADEKVREAAWMKVENGFGVLDGWIKRNAHEGPYVMGKDISFADFVLAAMVRSMKIVWGEDSKEWRDMSAWQDGRWTKWLEMFAEYEQKV